MFLLLQVTPDQAVQYEALLAGIGQRIVYNLNEVSDVIARSLETTGCPALPTLRLVLDMLLPDEAGKQAAAAIEQCVMVRRLLFPDDILPIRQCLPKWMFGCCLASGTPYESEMILQHFKKMTIYNAIMLLNLYTLCYHCYRTPPGPSQLHTVLLCVSPGTPLPCSSLVGVTPLGAAGGSLT